MYFKDSFLSDKTKSEKQNLINLNNNMEDLECTCKFMRKVVISSLPGKGKVVLVDLEKMNKEKNDTKK